MLKKGDMLPIYRIRAELIAKFDGADVDIVDWNVDQIEFAVNINGIWIEGLVKVKYDTDLEVYIQWPHKVDYSYQGDICWCDILLEEG